MFEEVAKFTCVASLSSRLEAVESGQNLAASAPNEERTRDREHSANPWEEEHSWRDPSAHSLKSVVIEWDDIQWTRRAMQVSFFFKCILNMELGVAHPFFRLGLLKPKNVLTFNHTSTSF